MSRVPCSRPSPVSRRRALLGRRNAVHLAKAACPRPPGLVVLVVDDEGLLVATRRDAPAGPAEVEAACSTLLDLSPPTGEAAAVLVSLDPGFGVDVSPAVCQAWRDLRRRFDRSHTTLVDWLLVTDDTTGSVAAGCGEPVRP